MWNEVDKKLFVSHFNCDVCEISCVHMWSWREGSWTWPVYSFTLYQKRCPCISHMRYRNFLFWEQVKFLILCGTLLLT